MIYLPNVISLVNVGYKLKINAQKKKFLNALSEYIHILLEKFSKSYYKESEKEVHIMGWRIY